MKPLVLLVEDNEPNRYLATFVLEGAGAEVMSASNGAVSFELARQRRPDVVVMDLSMPVMDGYQAAALFRADPRLCSVPIVAATAFAHPAERERALAAGFADYFEKPLDVERFTQAILSLAKNPGQITPKANLK